MKQTLIAAFAGLALLAATNAWAQGSRVSGQFHGPEVKIESRKTTGKVVLEPWP